MLNPRKSNKKQKKTDYKDVRISLKLQKENNE